MGISREILEKAKKGFKVFKKDDNGKLMAQGCVFEDGKVYTSKGNINQRMIYVSKLSDIKKMYHYHKDIVIYEVIDLGYRETTHEDNHLTNALFIWKPVDLRSAVLN